VRDAIAAIYVEITQSLTCFFRLISLSALSTNCPIMKVAPRKVSPTIPGNKVVQGFSTPESSPPDYIMDTRRTCQHNRTVQFGPSRAVEYHSEEASIHMNTIPSDVATNRYPHQMPCINVEDEALTLETKENTAILAAWEEDFAVFEDEEDNGDDWDVVSTRSRKRERRESMVFSLTEGNTSLLDEDDESSMDIAQLSKLSVLSPIVCLPAIKKPQVITTTEDPKIDLALPPSPSSPVSTPCNGEVRMKLQPPSFLLS
jgi:hypothetical protein